MTRDRRADETRSFLAAANKPQPWHRWECQGKCPLCGDYGPHEKPTGDSDERS